MLAELRTFGLQQKTGDESLGIIQKMLLEVEVGSPLGSDKLKVRLTTEINAGH
uniref:Uncharacterized protein n=1 Tax=Peronospora matthiolae TaxID=2874970 RepID=A0AAV1VAC5_9STRA